MFESVSCADTVIVYAHSDVEVSALGVTVELLASGLTLRGLLLPPIEK